MGGDIRPATADDVKFNPVDVRELDLANFDQRLQEIAKKGPTNKFDTTQEYYEALRELEKLLAGAYQKSYDSMTFSKVAVGDTVVMRDPNGVYQYMKTSEGEIVRKDLLTGNKYTIYYGGNPNRNWGEALKIATDGKIVFFLIKHYRDAGLELLSYAPCGGEAMQLTRPDGFGSTTAEDQKQIYDLIVEGGVVKVVFHDKGSSIPTKENLSSEIGYCFE